MPKVTLGLSDRDADNAAFVEGLASVRSKAHAVSVALALTRFVVDEMRAGGQLVVRKPDGTLERIVMPEFDGIALG